MGSSLAGVTRRCDKKKTKKQKNKKTKQKNKQTLQQKQIHVYQYRFTNITIEPKLPGYSILDFRQYLLNYIFV